MAELIAMIERILKAKGSVTFRVDSKTDAHVITVQLNHLGEKAFHQALIHPTEMANWGGDPTYLYRNHLAKIILGFERAGILPKEETP